MKRTTEAEAVAACLEAFDAAMVRLAAYRAMIERHEYRDAEEEGMHAVVCLQLHVAGLSGMRAAKAQEN